MAVFKPIISSIGYGVGNGLELFTTSDIYRYDVDNRPLENLSANDTAIKVSVDEIVDEITDSYEGQFWPTGVNKVYNALDDRLDNMDLFLQNFYEIRNVQFSAFMQNASFLKEMYTSGFLNGPFPSEFIRSNYSAENNLFMPSPFGGFYTPEKAGTVRNEEMPDEEMTNAVAIETRIEQDGTQPYFANRKPLYALVNGFTVPMISEYGGQSRKIKGNSGPIILNFSDAPTTGSRVDFTFLEVWLQVIPSSGGYFYPYGGLDFAQSKQESIGALNSGQVYYEGQVTGKKLIPHGQSVVSTRVYKLANASEVITNWSTVAGANTDLILWDDGSDAVGPIIDLVDPHGNGNTGTVDIDTGEVTVTYDSDPGAGDELIVFHRYRAVLDSSDERLRGTLSFLPNGDYLQIQHQWRVVDNINYEAYPDFFSDSTIEARGSNISDVGGYSFLNGVNKFHDGNLWYSGSGNAASKSALGTYDGYIYALPVGAWSRFNTTGWDTDNQNGGVARLDGLRHEYPDDKYFLDLRPCVLNERYTVDNASENTLDRIIRGAHRTLFNHASVYHYYGLEVASLTETLATEVAELWIVPKIDGISAYDPDYDYANRVFDLSIDDGFNDPPSGGDKTAFHDGVRRVRSPQEEVQELLVKINVGTVSATPSPLADLTEDRITFSVNSSSFSGYYDDAGKHIDKGLVINPSHPRLWWRGTRQPVILSGSWSGLGTKEAYADIDTFASSYLVGGIIDGYVDLLYPTCTGIDRPVSKIDGIQFNDGAITDVVTLVGNTDGSPAASQEDAKWHDEQGLGSVLTLPTGMAISPFTEGGEHYAMVCDEGNNRVIVLNAEDMSFVSQYPDYIANPTDYPFDPSSEYDTLKHLRSPSAVAWEDSASFTPATTDFYAYVTDRASHRLVKLSKDLSVYQTAFGVDNDPATDVADLNRLSSPQGVAVDSDGFIYVADTGMYRVVKIKKDMSGIESYIGTGESGSSLGQFISPTGLAIGSVTGGSPVLYVADGGRIVAIDILTFEVISVLGARTHENIADMYRYLAGGWATVAEDASNNKYVCWTALRKVIKFDSDWVIQAEFGIEGERDTTTGDLNENHLAWPLALAHDPDAHLVYVCDGYHDDYGDQQGYHRIVVLNDETFEYYDELNLNDVLGSSPTIPQANQAPTGIVYDGINSRLYITAGENSYGISLPAPGSRSVVNYGSSWQEEWVEPKPVDSGVAWSLALTADSSRLFIGDPVGGKIHEVVPATGISAGRDVTMPDTSGLRPWGISVSSDGDYIYAAGYDETAGNADRDKTLRVDISGPTTLAMAANPIYDTLNREGERVFYFTENNQGFVYALGENETYVYTSSGSLGDNIAGALYQRLADIPMNTELHLALDWEAVQGVHFYADTLYATDPKMNTITAIDAASMAVIGQVGSPAALGKGLASFSGPMGICVNPSNSGTILVADGYNNRVLKTTKHFPVVENGTGRMTYLTAPAGNFETMMQVRFNPYQGLWQNISEPVVYGRNFISDSNKIHISTLGRGSLSYVSQEGGIGHYANMTSRLPSPLGVPKLARYVGSDYSLSPTPLPITSETEGTPYATLPVINRYPASAQEFYPLYGGGSRYDFNRILFVQGPGDKWGAGEIKSWWRTQRGFDSTGSFPGFDVMETFPLRTLSIPRVVFTTATVELQGQLYLAISSTYTAHAKNTIGDGPIVVDMFKLFGNPGVKQRY